MSKRIWSGILAVLSCLVEFNEIATDFLANWLSRFARRVSLVAVLIVGGGVTYKLATASRNSSGSMVAINGPYSAPNVISSAAVNARFSDIESEISDSLSRSGKGGMTAPVRGANGTSTAPTYSFTSETTAGLYRNGAGDLRMAFNGTDAEQWASTGITVPGNITLSGTSSKLGIGGAPTDFLDVTLAGSASNAVGQWLEASLADGNGVTLYMGKNFSATGNAGVLQYNKNATSANSTFCLWLFGQTNTLCVDGNNKVLVGTGGVDLTSSSSGGIITGIKADGSGFKHQSVAGCATGASVGATCDNTLTWSTTFADTSYQAYCSCNAATSGIPHIGRYTIAAGSILVATVAGTAAAAQCSLVTCLAVHN
jgi:hypothetical protein